MGHKVHPMGFRLGIIRGWQAKWYAHKGPQYREQLQEDIRIRSAVIQRHRDGAISKVEIERAATEITATIHSARPGIIIGRGGQRVEELRRQLERLTGKRIRINIQEIRQPELDAALVSQSIAEQISRRVAVRRGVRQAMARTMQAGAQGIRVEVSGRLGGAEIARKEKGREGRVPLHTLRADIDYGFSEAPTAMGRLGVKVWVYKGDIIPEREIRKAAARAEAAERAEAEEAAINAAALAAAQTAGTLVAAAPPVEAAPPPVAPVAPPVAAAPPVEAAPPPVVSAAPPVVAAPLVEASPPPAEPVAPPVEVAAPVDAAPPPEAPPVEAAPPPVAEAPPVEPASPPAPVEPPTEPSATEEENPPSAPTT